MTKSVVGTNLLAKRSADFPFENNWLLAPTTLTGLGRWRSCQTGLRQPAAGWLLDDVAEHWDSLILRSWITEQSNTLPRRPCDGLRHPSIGSGHFGQTVMPKTVPCVVVR